MHIYLMYLISLNRFDMICRIYTALCYLFLGGSGMHPSAMSLLQRGLEHVRGSELRWKNVEASAHGGLGSQQIQGPIRSFFLIVLIVSCNITVMNNCLRMINYH